MMPFFPPGIPLDDRPTNRSIVDAPGRPPGVAVRPAAAASSGRPEPGGALRALVDE
jgi:hypothetical protein